MATNVRDPRSIITPDAFVLSEELLGTPLAPPARRLWALLIDLIVIGVLTAVTASISLVLWGAVGLFLISMAFRRPARSMSQLASVLFRGATGCLGTFILAGVLIGYLVVRAGDDEAPEIPPIPGVDLSVGAEGSTADPTVGQVLRGLTDLARFGQVDDTDEAARIAADMLRVAGAAGLSPADARELLDEAASDPAWADDRDTVYARAFRIAGIEADPEAAGTGTSAVGTLGDDLAEWPLSDAVERFTALRAQGDDRDLTPEEADTVASLRGRLVSDLAGDTLEALAERIDDVEDDLRDSSADLDEAQARLDSGEGGFRGLLRDIWDQLGSAIGLWSLYFTVALTLTGGRTVGKKLMGIRVLRLDGEPLNWWASFERAGGYVAGIATGTLGFAQVFWDSNRQCVHDKIVGTVVVIDGAQIEPGAWQEAWQIQKNSESGPTPEAP